MKREIKFRGQRVGTKEWIYGYYYTDTAFNGFSENKEELWTKSFIRKEKGTFDGLFLAVEVITESVGQFTGLLDKNGKEIYEGDVVKDIEFIGTYTITFELGCFGLKGNNDSLGATGKRNSNFHKMGKFTQGEKIQIIGNIYENPELIN